MVNDQNGHFACVDHNLGIGEGVLKLFGTNVNLSETVCHPDELDQLVKG